MDNSRGRRMPNRNENQSFSLSKQDQDKIKKIRHILNNTRPDELKSRLSITINSSMPNPEVISKLYETLCKVGVIQSHMIEGAAYREERHCVRCHRAYKERSNNLTSCWVVNEQILMPAIGRHTTRTDIDYDGVILQSCSDLNCAGNGVRTQIPNPTFDDSEACKTETEE